MIAKRRQLDGGVIPIKDELLVPLQEEESVCRRLPELSKELNILSRDEDGERIQMDISVGDKILYSKFAGTEVKLDSDEYLVLSERDVLAIVN